MNNFFEAFCKFFKGQYTGLVLYCMQIKSKNLANHVFFLKLKLLHLLYDQTVNAKNIFPPTIDCKFFIIYSIRKLQLYGTYTVTKNLYFLIKTEPVTAGAVFMIGFWDHTVISSPEIGHTTLHHLGARFYAQIHIIFNTVFQPSNRMVNFSILTIAELLFLLTLIHRACQPIHPMGLLDFLIQPLLAF